MFGYFLLVVALTMCLTFSNCTDDAVNNISLTEHVKQIDEILSTYQAQYQAQERKDATILANILSELSQTKQDMAKLQTNHNITLSLYQQTVSELVDLKTSHNKTISELWDLKTSHNKTVSELWDLKTSHNKTVSELSDLRSSHNKAVSELSILQKKLNETASETSALQTSHNKTVFEVSALQKYRNDTSLEVSVLQNRTNDTKFQLSELDKSHNEAVLELSTLTTSLNQTILDLIETRSKLEEMKTQINALLNTGIGFEANLMEAKTISASGTIIFDKVQHNHGGGYNETTGCFTAPVSGTYLFWTNIVYRSNTFTISFYIQKKGEILGRAYGRANEAFGSASSTTCIYLKKGELVWIRSSKEVELIAVYPSAGAVLIKQY